MPPKPPNREAVIQSLRADLAATVEALSDVAADRDRWRDAKPLPDAEAAAIAECVAALDKMVGGSNRDAYRPRTRTDAVTRVLHFLADRYDVDWPAVSSAVPEQITASMDDDVRRGDQIVVETARGTATRIGPTF